MSSRPSGSFFFPKARFPQKEGSWALEGAQKPLQGLSCSLFLSPGFLDREGNPPPAGLRQHPALGSQVHTPGNSQQAASVDQEQHASEG